MGANKFHEKIILENYEKLLTTGATHDIIKTFQGGGPPKGGDNLERANTYHSDRAHRTHRGKNAPGAKKRSGQPPKR